MEFLSPLRYPGGKAKVADFVQCLIKENALLDGTYVEPYVGGGSVAADGGDPEKNRKICKKRNPLLENTGKCRSCRKSCS